jgi:predicted TIM-barrel fold metal-dependent hydrolase
MATTAVTPDVSASPSTFIIDTDVHEGMRSTAELEPYLKEHWRRWRGITPHPQVFSMPYAVPDHSNVRLDWKLPDSDGTTGTDPGMMVKHLFDEEGVSIAVLNGLFHPSASGASWDYACAVVSAYNDWQIDQWLNRDDRLRGSVHVVAHNPEHAVREIERVGPNPQMVQVFLPTVTDRQYGDPMYRPIFAAAARHELAVTFHHGAHTRTVLGYPRYYVEWHTLAAPQATAGQATSLICSGMFEELPDLRVVFLESGVAWVPWLMWRLDQRAKEERREVPWLKRLPSEIMREHVRFSTQPLGDIKPKQFLQLIEMAEAEKLFVFSTDYPHFDADSTQTIQSSTLPLELRERICWRNALEAYPRLRASLDLPA